MMEVSKLKMVGFTVVMGSKLTMHLLAAMSICKLRMLPSLHMVIRIGQEEVNGVLATMMAAAEPQLNGNSL